MGTTCLTSCNTGSAACKDTKCKDTTGRCTNCRSNTVYGVFCEKKCTITGHECLGDCDRDTGECTACVSGFFGEKKCNQKCNANCAPALVGAT